MRELTTDEIDLVSAGPSAVPPVDLRYSPGSIPTSASPGIFLSIENVFTPSQPIAIAK